LFRLLKIAHSARLHIPANEMECSEEAVSLSVEGPNCLT